MNRRKRFRIYGVAFIASIITAVAVAPATTAGFSDVQYGQISITFDFEDVVPEPENTDSAQLDEGDSSEPSEEAVPAKAETQDTLKQEEVNTEDELAP